MKIFPKILIVDNEIKEINELVEAFSLARLPCLPILYKAEFPSIEKLECNAQVRIVFCDINLTEITLSSQSEDPHSDATKVSSFIKDALEKVTGDGPFYLVFWSKHSELADSIMAIFNEREEYLSSKIIDYCVMDKSTFKGDALALKAKVEDIVSSNDILSSVIAIEHSVSLAVHEVINELFVEGGRDLEHLKKVLAILSNNSAGNINSKEMPYSSLMEALTPLVNNKVIKYEVGYENLFKDTLKDYLGSPIVLENTIKHRINTAISTDAVYFGEKIPLIRGSFFKLTCEELFELTSASINDDSGVVIEAEGLTEGDRSKNHNFSSIINSQFLKKEHWNIKNPNHVSAINNHITFGLFELSAACDQAQNNRPLHRFALSAVINKKLADTSNVKFNIDKNSWSEVTYGDCPLIAVDGEIYSLRVSNKYIFGLHKDYRAITRTPWIRFNEQIVEQVLEFNARYGSRRGIYKI